MTESKTIGLCNSKSYKFLRRSSRRECFNHHLTVLSSFPPLKRPVSVYVGYMQNTENLAGGRELHCRHLISWLVSHRL